MTTVTSVISKVACFGWQMHQLDIKMAFLNGDLQEEVHVLQPPGSVMPRQECEVCRLKIYDTEKICVDDMLLIGNNTRKISDFKADLRSTFAMSNMGYCNTIWEFSLCKMIAKPISTPMEPRLKLSVYDGSERQIGRAHV